MKKRFAVVSTSQRNAARKRFRRRVNGKRKRQQRRRLLHVRSSYFQAIDGEYYRSNLVAPSDFSFDSNREGVLQFISTLESNMYGKVSTFVSLSTVVDIDIDAIVMLLAIMAEFDTFGVRFNGDLPLSADARDKLRSSGFLDQLYPSGDSYQFGDKQGIFTHGTNICDQSLSARIVSDALIAVFGEKRRSQGAQRVLIEAMKNTIHHAALVTEKQRHWWLSVSKDPNNKRVIFSFLDYGVGIFESLQSKGPNEPAYSWIRKNLSLGVSNTRILKGIMSGELTHVSRTRKPKHGTGLPGMKSALENNFISKLVILSNDVLADVGAGTYESLNQSFSGTLIQFEIIKTCKSFDYE